MARFIIIDVPNHREFSKADAEIKANLVVDSGGEVVDVNCLGLVVECKKRVGQALDLLELVHVEEVVQYA